MFQFVERKPPQVNTNKVVGKVGEFNIGFRTEQLASYGGCTILPGVGGGAGGRAKRQDAEACLWQQQGKRAEAHKLLFEVYNWFTEGFDTKDLQEAKELLESLESQKA